MEYILKLSAISIIAATFALIVKKTNAEIAFILGTCTAVMVIFCSLNLFYELIAQLKRWEESLSISFSYFMPLLKCTAISIISQLGSNLSKDAGQNAVAVGLELCGNFVSAICLIPIIEQLFSVIRNLL